jgi:hypothetical protein
MNGCCGYLCITRLKPTAIALQWALTSGIPQGRCSRPKNRKKKSRPKMNFFTSNRLGVLG